MAKAVFRHVKAKSAWKNVQIPQQLMDNELFNGLIDVQELTDYELVSEEINLDNDGGLLKSSSKSKKRKKDSGESELGAPEKKKKKSTEVSTTEIIPPEIVMVKTKSKTKKKKKKNTEVSTTQINATEIEKVKTMSKGKKKNDKNPGLSQLCKDDLHATTKPDEKETNVLELQNTTDKDMSQWKNLFVPDELMRSLQEQGFENPTEIQVLTLPSAIRDRKDILGAAETGSGKTLAFGIPLLAQILSLQNRDDVNENQSDDPESNDEEQNLPLPKCAPKALILEPTRELAVQVKKHLTRLAVHTKIKFVTVVGGMSVEKQYRVLKGSPEVIIATPGRLWQLIEEGEAHLSKVDLIHSLVVDEADRMVEKGHYEELTKILNLVNESPRRIKKRQTYVMSATLTMEIGLPHRLKNKVKKKKKTVDESKLKQLTERMCIGTKPKVIDLTTKDKVARTLTELRLNCTVNEKDFYLYYFLCEYPGRTLVFVNSKDCLRRLVSLFTLLQCSPLPLHADMHQTQRLKNLDRFTAQNKSLLVASDVAARGLDIPCIDHVIHYQVPRTIENYVHRSGRTARASSHGLTVMLVGAGDARDYRKIVQAVKNGKEVPIMPLDLDLMPAVKNRVELARSIDVTEHRSKKKKSHNNFFQKAAQDMDIIIDDDKLLLDLGSSVEQSEEKQDLKSMKQQLGALLKRPLAPLHMTKYPTKSGKLMTKKVIDLYDV